MIVWMMFSLIACRSENKESSVVKEEWTSLFNGKDLTGWTPKISGYVYGDNHNNTFRVVDSLLTVSYENYDTFTDQFGHLFYEKPFSSYHLKLEYKFYGDQAPGGPQWAYRNNGIMFHSQEPSTMELNQAFPVCMELQFLGGNGQDDRSTGNLCTPGSNVHIDGSLVTDHCINSTSSTYHGDQWVSAELIVYADSIAHHIIEGDTVFTYTHLQVGGGGEPDSYPDPEGTPMRSGYIAVQAETAPTAFRKIMIREL